MGNLLQIDVTPKSFLSNFWGSCHSAEEDFHILLKIRDIHSTVWWEGRGRKKEFYRFCL